MKKLYIFLAFLIVFGLYLFVDSRHEFTDYAKLAQEQLDSDRTDVSRYYEAMKLLSAWEEELPSAVNHKEYKEIYAQIIQGCKELEFQSGEEFSRNIDYEGGCEFSATSNTNPAIITVKSTDDSIRVTFFVRGGETGSIFLPANEYIVSYQTGKIVFPSYPDGGFGQFIEQSFVYPSTFVLKQINDGAGTIFTTEHIYIA